MLLQNPPFHTLIVLQSSKRLFKRFAEIGSVALINYGKDYGRLVVVNQTRQHYHSSSPISEKPDENLPLTLHSARNSCIPFCVIFELGIHIHFAAGLN
ncbi:hypothetical protein P8452_45577 [Trifolium repens]|nr:hypothetical protein P8452_45577 [Trifolium repens]